MVLYSYFCFFFHDTATTEIYTLSLHDALPIFNLEEEFRRDVIDDFLSEYRSGRTPVPCVHCNSGPKFRHLLRRAIALGSARIATGHYARTMPDPATGRSMLLRASDASKDQSYFLFDLTQEQLARAVFP